MDRPEFRACWLFTRSVSIGPGGVAWGDDETEKAFAPLDVDRPGWCIAPANAMSPVWSAQVRDAENSSVRRLELVATSWGASGAIGATPWVDCEEWERA